MQIGLTVLAIACAACLGGCAGMSGNPADRTGTVAGVYVETAPGLFLERNLAEHRPGATVAVVSLADVPPDDGSTATAWVARGTAVARGDVVRVRLSRENGRARDGVVPTGDRVLDVVAADDAAVAAVAVDGL